MSGGDTLEADGTMAQPRACTPAHKSFARAAHSAPSQRVEDSFVAAVAELHRRGGAVRTRI